MRLACHQPNFFPHLAYFEKMKQVDKFVILACCQFEKGGYQNRFRYRNNWYTMSVSKKTELINFKKYLYWLEDWERIVSSLKDLNIRFHFEPCIDESLVKTNCRIIFRIRNLLEIGTEISIQINSENTGTARLVEICKEQKADTYLSGPSGKNYLDLELFDKAGIKVEFQKPSESVPILEHIYGR